MAASRSWSRPTASACRTSSTSRRCARCSRASPVARSPSTRSRRVRASPFASSLLFDYVAAYMYDGDAPLAERRAGALTLDRDLLRELLGQEELRELLDPDALADLELSPPGADRGPSGDDRRPASTTCCAGSATSRPTRWPPGSTAVPTVAGPWLDELASTPAGRAGAGSPVTIAGSPSRTSPGIATASGVAAPVGVPEAFLAPVSGALDGLLARWARTHGPFLTPEPARRWGLPVGVVGGRAGATARQRARSFVASSGRVARNASGATLTSCGCSAVARWPGFGARSSRSILWRSPGSCPTWHGVAPIGRARPPFRGTAALERLAEVVDQLAGMAIPASVLERDVLPARIPGYQPRLLDELGALGEVAWVGRGSLGRDDGRVVLVRPGRDALRPVGLPDGADRPTAPRHDADPRAPGAPRRLLLPRAVRRGGRRHRPRGPRRAVGPGLGGRGHQRHVRPAAGPALEADRRAAGPRRPAARPTDDARSARGRGSLVARRAAHGHAATERLHAQCARAARAPRGPDARGGRRRRASRAGSARSIRSCGRSRRRAGSGAATSSTGSARRSSRWRARSIGCARAREPEPRRRRRPRARRRRPGQPVRRRPAWPRRDEHDRRPIQRAAGAYVVLVDGAAALYLERGGATLQTLAPADDAEIAVTAARALGTLVADGRLRELVMKQGRRRCPSRTSPFRERLLEAGSSPGYRGLARCARPDA